MSNHVARQFIDWIVREGRSEFVQDLDRVRVIIFAGRSQHPDGGLQGSGAV